MVVVVLFVTASTCWSTCSTRRWTRACAWNGSLMNAARPMRPPARPSRAGALARVRGKRVAVGALVMCSRWSAWPRWRPWITPQNPYDLNQISILDARWRRARQSPDGKLASTAGHRRPGPRHALGHRLRAAHLACSWASARTVGPRCPGTDGRPHRGLFRRLGRRALMRIVDIQLSFPGHPDGADAAGHAGQGRGQGGDRAGAVQWAYYARTVRGRRWWRARRNTSRRRACLACRGWRIMLRHLLPNCLPPLIVVATVQVAQRHRAGGHAVVPGPGPADHRAVAGPADRQRLPVPAVGQVLDQLLSPAWRCCSPSWRSTWWATRCATC
jgi:peptide/nickel transport system permease protein